MHLRAQVCNLLLRVEQADLLESGLHVASFVIVSLGLPRPGLLSILRGWCTALRTSLQVSLNADRATLSTLDMAVVDVRTAVGALEIRLDAPVDSLDFVFMMLIRVGLRLGFLLVQPIGGIRRVLRLQTGRIWSHN